MQHLIDTKFSKIQHMYNTLPLAMKFFFSDLGSCYRPSALPAADEPTSTTTTQMPVTCNGSDHGTSSKRINELAPPTRSKSTAHWKPALAVISEDGVVSVERKTARSEKKLPSKSRSMARPRCLRSNDGYEYDYSGKHSMPVIIPAFSPTPFMF